MSIPGRRGRSPYGERGLKYVVDDAAPACPGRSPYGERGLKCRPFAIGPRWKRVALLTESVD